MTHPVTEERFRDAYDRLPHDVAVAEHLLMPRVTVCWRRHRYGLPAKLGAGYGVHQREPRVSLAELVQLHAAGLNDTEIARELSVHRASIRNWRHRLGLVSNWVVQ